MESGQSAGAALVLAVACMGVAFLCSRAANHALWASLAIGGAVLASTTCLAVLEYVLRVDTPTGLVWIALVLTGLSAPLALVNLYFRTDRTVGPVLASGPSALAAHFRRIDFSLVHLPMLMRLGLRMAWTFCRAWFRASWRIGLVAGLASVPLAPLNSAQGGFATFAWIVGTAAGGVLVFRRAFASLAVSAALSVRQLVAGAERVLSQDTRRPVLLLRSFSDDDLTVERSSFLGRVFGVSRTTARLEDVICDVGFRYGPVVSLSEPGRAWPGVGSARFAVRARWRDLVDKELERAAVIVLVSGGSDGLSWEISRIYQRELARRVIVVCPPGRRPFTGRETFDALLAPWADRDDGEGHLDKRRQIMAATYRAEINDFVSVTDVSPDVSAYRLALNYCFAVQFTSS